MLAAIESAKESIRLETYIYSADALGQRFRDALVKAQQRGTKVRVLFDALGSRICRTRSLIPCARLVGRRDVSMPPY